MVTLTHDAQNYLDRYLRQLKVALRGHTAVDVTEVERDVLGHIDAELAGQTEPVEARSLRQVLDRLGAPDQWVPADELPGWRRTLNRIQSGPEDWRLAYFTFVSLLCGWGLFLTVRPLWPLPPILVIASFVAARATLAVLAEHDEPVGPRRWFIYPTLLIWYSGFAAFLLLWPLPPVVLAVEDTPFVQDWIARSIPGPRVVVSSAAIILAVGGWWLALGLLLRRFHPLIQLAFWPFADWLNRRHATRLAITGLVLLVIAGGVLFGVRA